MAGSAAGGVRREWRPVAGCPRLETAIFRLLNDLPSELWSPLKLVMQAGTFGAVWMGGAVALVVAVRRTHWAWPVPARASAFRLVTYWLPIVPGAVVVRVLRRRQAL